jgi:hypothetical protein
MEARDHKALQIGCLSFDSAIRGEKRVHLTIRQQGSRQVLNRRMASIVGGILEPMMACLSFLERYLSIVYLGRYT